MVERGHPAGVASFVVPEGLAAYAPLTLGEEVAHHMRVRRLANGAPLRLTDGAGRVAGATLIALAKHSAQVDVGGVTEVPPPPPVHLLAPIGDRDHMLWLAEKAAELAVTSWRPVLWRRSRSVQPRGEGAAFQGKVRARMQSAVAQSRGAWLPTVFPDATLDRALAGLTGGGARWVLEAEGAGAPAALADIEAPVTIAVGPEGGFEPEELERLDAAGFRRLTLGPTILRFETAGVAGLSLARAWLTAAPAPDAGAVSLA